MRLTAFLMHWKNKKPHGHFFRGKNRVVPAPKMEHVLRLRHDFEREEKNMLILRHPYLTIEQSYGHMMELREPRVPVDTNSVRNAKFNKHFKWEHQLVHLRCTESWD